MSSPTPIDSQQVEPSKWPTVWGVLFLCYAGFTLLGSCCGTISVFLSPMMMQAIPGMDDVGPMPAVMRIWMVVDLVVSIVLVVLLCMAGLGALRRRRSFQKMAMAYVVFRLLLIVPGVGVAIMAEKPMAEWQRQLAAAQVAAIEKDGRTAPQSLKDQAATSEVSSMSRITTFGATLLSSIFPVVVGLVFSSRSKKDEIATWSN